MEGVGVAMIGIEGTPKEVDAFLKSQAAHALVGLRYQPVLTKEPMNNILYAVTTITDAYNQLAQQPAPMAAQLASDHSIALQGKK